MVAGLRANAAAVNPVPYSELIMDSGIALRSSGIAPTASSPFSTWAWESPYS